jgi:hypothetical protein
LEIFVLYEERRGEERRGEKRRERSMWMRIELGDLHPHPPKKLLHVLVVIALIVEQACGGKKEWDGKEKRNNFQHMQKYQTCYVCDMGDIGMSKLEWYCKQEQLCNSQVYAPIHAYTGTSGADICIPYNFFPFM